MAARPGSDRSVGPQKRLSVPRIPSGWANSQSSAIATIVLTLLGWSSIPLFLRYFTAYLDPWTANGWRYAISSVLWLPVIVWAYRRSRVPDGLWRAALVPSLFNALGQICFALAPYMVDPGLMTFGLRLQIVFAAAGAALLFPLERELLRRPWFLGGLIVVACGTLATVALKPGGFEAKSTLGVIVSIASGLFYACYSLSVRRWMNTMNPLVAFAAVSQYTSAVLIVLMLFLAPRAGANVMLLTTAQVWLLVLSSVVGIGLGHTLYFYSLRRLGVAVSAGVVQLQPFLVAAASVQLFNEQMRPVQWVTGAMAICGAGVMLVAQHRWASAREAKRRRDMEMAIRTRIPDPTAAN
jgi:drug/metabolite transporter (DMT)-like permease